MYFNIQPDQDEQAVIKQMKKRRNIYILFYCAFFVGAVLVAWLTQSFMATVGGILAMVVYLAACVCASLTVWCINNIRYVQSHGTKQGGGLLWLVFFLLGLVIFPIIIVLIMRNTGLGTKALGLK